MNTSQIKNFATQSRNILKTGVIQRIQILGFDANGNLTKGEPTRIDIQGGATLFAGEIFDGAFYDRWTSLRRRIQEKGVKEVYEEAAYTWFNRLVAIRIMMKNGFIDPVLAYTNEQTRIPRIVAEARAGRFGKMSTSDREKLRELMGDDARINEQFAILIENFCRNNAVIFNCFGGIEEYISLLLPDNILAPDGFIDLLNHTSYITDEDYKQSELIGWLYQFYISEKKDEVFDGFKKGKKAEAEDIPAATQIFTPNWIVKYMVQNTLGRIYLDNNPYSEIKSEMKYLVEPAEPTPKDAILKIENLEDYKIMDNACGSGHILVEGFDLFYKMYLEEAYSSRVAIENIFRKNLIGIDIDTRAKQLATFALLMKAAHVDPTFLDCKVMPRVLDMPGSTFSRPLTELLREFYMSDDSTLIQETYDAFELLKQAHNLGSIMKFNLSNRTRKEMEFRYNEWDGLSNKSAVGEILPSIALILALSDKYAVITANPPYMGSGNMNSVVTDYVVDNYSDSKSDMMTVFISASLNSIQKKGYVGMITYQSWMFLSSFVDMRRRLIDNYQIQTLIHIGRGMFGSDFGTVSFTIQNKEPDKNGYYRRLFEKHVNVRQVEVIRNIFLNWDYHVYSANQKDFLNIPGNPIGYWISKRVIESFSKDVIGDFAVSNGQNITGDNDRFIRYFWEVSSRQVKKGGKWPLLAKGGDFRKWYGNVIDVIDWSEEARSFYKESKIARIQDPSLWFRDGITWNLVTAHAGFRLLPSNTLFNKAAPTLLLEPDDLDYLPNLMGFLNTNIAKDYLNLLNPTVNTNIKEVFALPYERMQNESIDNLVLENIKIERNDWDAHEISWDFKINDLVRIYIENHGEGLFFDANRLSDVVVLFKEYWINNFNKLRNNEIQINKDFIELYGLQDEQTSEIPLDEVTILQQGEISIDEEQVIWNDDVLIKQLISYAIGCMMGRYRLDRQGLHIAYPNPSQADVEAYDFQGEKFEIDDDGIIPLLIRDCPFDDNAYNRVVKFIRQVFGESFLNENLNFIEDALGKTIENYFVKDFWKDHKKMYSNRPIYWLFSSKKGAFQCLTYMHRMNPYTAEAVRSKYLLPYIDFLKNKIAADMERASSLSTVERKNLDKMQAALDECLEYEEILHDVADRQIRFDLDDGVVVNYAKFGDVLAKIK